MKTASRQPSVPQSDQAAGLRELLANRPTQVIAFAGGGRGSGRTTLAVETAMSLGRADHRTILVDENDGPGNALTSLGIGQTGDLVDALILKSPLESIIWRVEANLWAASAAKTAAFLRVDSPKAMEIAATLMTPLEAAAKFVLIDSLVLEGGHLSLLSALAHHMAVVVAANPDTITQAYAVIKRLAKERGREGFHLAITHARSDKEAATIYGNVRMTAERHLGVRVAFLGSMPFPLPQDVGEILLKRLPMADADAQKRYALQTGSPQ